MRSSGEAMITISAFESARALDPAVGTIFAKIVEGTRYVDGDHLVVQDFSGSLEVWVPRSLHDRGTGLNKWFAFDVVAEPESCSVVELVERVDVKPDVSTDLYPTGRVCAESTPPAVPSEFSITVSAQRPVINR